MPVPIHAATWTVDEDESRPADFRNVQQAVDAAAPDDVILLAGRPGSVPADYGWLNLSKRLIIKGPGYGDRSSQVNIKLFPGADGSRFEGLILHLDSESDESSVDGIVINRCTGGDWTLYGDRHTISQSFTHGYLQILGNQCMVRNTFSKLHIYGDRAVVEHCVIDVPTAIATEGGGAYFSFGSETSVSNSIIIRPGGNTTFAAGTIRNCLALGDDNILPLGNGNISGGLLEDVFEGPFSWPTDTSYRLKNGSLAKGAGLGGVDMGMFGGTKPYVIGGIPPIPRVTSLIVPAVVPDSSGLTFEVEAEARD
jgi:hypothetical protein